MSIKKLLACACALVLVSPTGGYAMRAAFDQGVMPMPTERQESISLDSVHVRVSRGDTGGFRVSCTLVLRNHAKARVGVTMALPVVHPDAGDMVAESLRVTVDGEPAKTRLEMKEKNWDAGDACYWRPAHKTLNYPGRISWQVDLDPEQVRKVRCEHTAGICSQHRGLEYITRTAGGWKGTIRKADIALDLGVPPYRRVPEHARLAVQIACSERATWESESEVRWRFEDWAPEEDVAVRLYSWRCELAGPYAAFLVPRKYTGSEKPWTDEALDRLVEEQIAPWRNIFPREVKALDRGKLKARIAEVLFNEISARHGDLFRLPNGRSSPWYHYFTRYYLHGGWYYRARTEPRPPLNDMEKRNRKFLATYMGLEKRRLEEYRDRIEESWPGAGKHLTVIRDHELFFTLARYERRDQVTDLAPLAHMRFDHLDLSGCHNIRDLEPLKERTFASLVVGSPGVTDLSPLASVVVRSLRLDDCLNVEDFTPLKALAPETLCLEGTQIRDLSVVEGMSLRKLSVAGCKGVTNLGPLREMPIKTLFISGTNVRDLSPLRGISLTWLKMRDCGGITDLSPLGEMKYPQFFQLLDIAGTSVADVSALEGAGLRKIVLDPGRITEGMEVLRGMKTLTRLGTPSGGMPPTEFWKAYDAGEFK